VLATDGPAAELGSFAGGLSLRIVEDRRRFGAIVQSARPDVVVCAMPPAIRADLVRLAAERTHRPSMRIVFLAPDEAAAERLDALAMGFDDALPATLDAAELAGRLSLLARSRVAPARSGRHLTIGVGLELDLDARLLRRGDRILHLRPKELGLLAELAIHPGVAFTRQELLRVVWAGRTAGPRTVDVHVRWLRSKIEADPGSPTVLVTVRGVGYRLDPPQR